MNFEKQNSDHWEACPQGELARMTGRLDAMDRRRQTGRIFRVATASMVVLAAGVLVAGSIGGFGDTIVGGIGCAECHQNFAAYHQNFAAYHQSLHSDSSNAVSPSTVQLGPEFMQSMADHLAGCKRCRRLYNGEFPGAVLSESASRSMPILASRWFKFTYNSAEAELL